MTLFLTKFLILPLFLFILCCLRLNIMSSEERTSEVNTGTEMDEQLFGKWLLKYGRKSGLLKSSASR